MIAALYIDPNGPYPQIPDVDCWDETRDARNYVGDLPVVAHPPCNVWCGFARLNEKRYGHTVGGDGGCFAHALAAVKRCRGVLEHPAGSLAWVEFALPRPKGFGWMHYDGVWVCEVWQSAYGHLARKRTWLLYVGEKPLDLRWERPKGTHQIGWFDRKKPTLSKTESKRTPTLFAEALVRLATHRS